MAKGKQAPDEKGFKFEARELDVGGLKDILGAITGGGSEAFGLLRELAKGDEGAAIVLLQRSPEVVLAVIKAATDIEEPERVPLKHLPEVLESVLKVNPPKEVIGWLVATQRSLRPLMSAVGEEKEGEGEDEGDGEKA